MIDNLSDGCSEYDFFQAVQLLEKHYSTHSTEGFSGVGECQDVTSERIQFAVSPSLGFPKSDVQSITHMGDEHRQFSRVEVNFLGLHGASSPLPTAYTEKLAGREGEENPVKDFFDFFHNRYLSLLYRVWKKYRYHIQYKSGATDPFSTRMLHFVGLSSVIQQLDVAHLDRAKLLSYSNQLSTRTRSPKLISGIVSHYFSLENVEVEEWVYRRVEIAEEQKSILNRGNCALGRTFHLGQSVADLTGKFNLHIHNIDFATYVKFTPGHEYYLTLLGLMKFILRDPLAWDLVLDVNLDSVPKNDLGHGSGNVLGETFWLGNPAKKDTKIKLQGSA
ncbi:type VI secretion system baseplate subunit TssG [Vibrio profundum]|uniref:type VI secretion system baseplate subunit TssG n=1 Tax=Vibrio profundum TaxID=2910247 RepID=UPI003D0D27DC